MKYYSVKEIAELLSVNEETVRRWIRDEKLEAERGSGRQGSKVTSEALKKFLEENKGLMTTMAATTLGLNTVIGGAAAALFVAGPLAAKIIAESISTLRNKSKDKTEKKIDLMEKETELNDIATRLKNEIAVRQNELRNIEMKLRQLKEIVSEIDEGGIKNGEN